MKHIILFIFILIASVSFGANFYWIGGGANSNWNTVGNWSATSGGGSNGSTPSSTSDVFFDGAGANGNTASTIAGNITVLSLTFNSGYTNTVTQNTASNLTIAGSFTDNTAHSWAVNGTSKLIISAASTITSGGKTYPGPVQFTGTNTKTLSGNWTITGLLDITGTTTLNWTTNETLTAGGLTMNAACSGTAKVILSGGTWQTNGNMSNNMDIQGNVTVSGSVGYLTGTLTYVSGTVTTTSSTLVIGGNLTLNTNGMSWNNITMNAAGTLTLNSTLTATGTFLAVQGNLPTFAGTSGFSIGTFTIQQTGAGSVTFNDAAATYLITTALNAFNSRTGSILTFTSDDATNKAPLTLQQGATCNVLANFTRIDASGGRTIRSFNGTITSCVNVVAFNDIGTSKH